MPIRFTECVSFLFSSSGLLYLEFSPLSLRLSRDLGTVKDTFPPGSIKVKCFYLEAILVTNRLGLSLVLQLNQFIVFCSDVKMEFRAINYQRRTFVTGGHNILNITKATKLTSLVSVKTRTNGR